jgi:hypothetical protein
MAGKEFGSESFISTRKEKPDLDLFKEQMPVLAREFPFIVYSIHYDQRTGFRSVIFFFFSIRCSVWCLSFRQPSYIELKQSWIVWFSESYMIQQRNNPGPLSLRSKTLSKLKASTGYLVSLGRNRFTE